MCSLLLRFVQRGFLTLLLASAALLFSACSSDGGGGDGNGGLTDAETPTIWVQPEGTSYNQYGNALPLTVTASVSDGGTLSYQWYKNYADVNSGGEEILSATSERYPPPTDEAGSFYYYVVVTNTNTAVNGSQTAETASETAAVMISGGDRTNAETPIITVPPQSAAYALNVNATDLSVNASISDGGTLSYKWYRNMVNSATGGTLVSQTERCAVSTGAMGTYYYFVVVTNTNNAVDGSRVVAVTSEIAVITVLNAAVPHITVHPQSASYALNDVANLSVTASVSDGGTLSYKWYRISSNTGVLVAETETPIYTAPTNIVGTVYYYVVVINTKYDVSGNLMTATATSNAVAITVDPASAETPSITVHPQDNTYARYAPSLLSVAASVSDGGILSYQWFSSTINSNEGGTVIASATAATYAPPTGTEGVIYYYVVVTNTNDKATVTKDVSVASNVAEITIVSAILHTANFYESGTLVSSVYDQNITLPTPTPISGYTFDGWYVDNTGSLAPSPYYLTGETNFYARWIPVDPTTPKVKAVFYDDGIEVASIEEYTVNHINLPAVTRNGYDFNGWLEEKTSITANPIFVISADTKFNSDFDLTAPYTEIRTAADMELIRTGLSGRYKLMNDIDLGGVDWTPIGGPSYSSYFTGVFEGNGQTIRRLYINSYPHHAGLFGGIANSARIANLTVEITGTGITGTNATGGIVGTTDTYQGAGDVVNKIVNTHVKISNGSTPKIKGPYTGGIVGALGGSTTISNCSNEVPVEGASRAGGIGGYANGRNYIYNSWNTGAVTGDTTGGIIGYAGNYSYIYNSWNTGAVTGSIAGGIIGSIGSVINSYNKGDVTAISSGAATAGGIVGDQSSNTAAISGNYNTGNVSATSTGEGAVYAGGIVGYRTAASVSNNVAANGSVTGSTSGTTKKVNRVVAYSDVTDLSKITNNFARSDMSDSSAFENVPAYLGTGKSESELKAQTTYEGVIVGDGLGGLGWQFCDGVTILCDTSRPWKMPQPDGSAYPRLYWE
jgi:uncharacterized repeat protein (TIGR02543 family)